MDNEMRLEAIEDAMYHINEAIDRLREVDKDMAETLIEHRAVLAVERYRLHSIVTRQQAEEQAELEREYWLSVF